MIFTGSNALNLEISADSSRRAIKRELYPMNFTEYLNLKYNFNINNHFTEVIFDIIRGNLEKVRVYEQEIQLNEFQ